MFAATNYKWLWTVAPVSLVSHECSVKEDKGNGWDNYFNYNKKSFFAFYFNTAHLCNDFLY